MREKIILTNNGSCSHKVLDRSKDFAVIWDQLVKKTGNCIYPCEAGDNRIGYRVMVYSHNDLGGIKNYLSTYFRTAINQIQI